MEDFRSKLEVREGARGTLHSKKEAADLLIVTNADSIVQHFNMSKEILSFVLATQAVKNGTKN
jgi:hypothetical protein